MGAGAAIVSNGHNEPTHQTSVNNHGTRGTRPYLAQWAEYRAGAYLAESAK